MSLQPEQPFNETELRYFLAEILKTSNVPPTDLVKLIQDRSILPAWDLMALPNGRSAAACRNQFNLLTNRLSSILAPGPPLYQPAPPKIKKRRSSLEHGSPETSLPPQQYQFAPINDPSNPVKYQSMAPVAGEGSEKSGKKRGRPSKQERELREAEAAARGEVYQPTKRKKPAHRQSTGLGTGDSASAEPREGQRAKSIPPSESEAPSGPSAPSWEASTSGRGKPPQAAVAVMEDQMQVDSPEGSMRRANMNQRNSGSPPLDPASIGYRQSSPTSADHETAPQPRTNNRIMHDEISQDRS